MGNSLPMLFLFRVGRHKSNGNSLELSCIKAGIPERSGKANIFPKFFYLSCNARFSRLQIQSLSCVILG